MAIPSVAEPQFGQTISYPHCGHTWLLDAEPGVTRVVPDRDAPASASAANGVAETRVIPDQPAATLPASAPVANAAAPAAVFDADRLGEQQYIAAAFLPGHTLAAELAHRKEGQPVDYRQAAQTVRHLADTTPRSRPDRES